MLEKILVICVDGDTGTLIYDSRLGAPPHGYGSNGGKVPRPSPHGMSGAKKGRKKQTVFRFSLVFFWCCFGSRHPPVEIICFVSVCVLSLYNVVFHWFGSCLAFPLQPTCGNAASPPPTPVLPQRGGGRDDCGRRRRAPVEIMRVLCVCLGSY